MAKANPMTFRRTTILVLFMLFVISLEAAAIYDKNVSCGNKKQGNDSKGIATNKLIVFQSLPRFRAARFHRKQRAKGLMVYLSHALHAFSSLWSSKYTLRIVSFSSKVISIPFTVMSFMMILTIDEETKMLSTTWIS